MADLIQGRARFGPPCRGNTRVLVRQVEILRIGIGKTGFETGLTRQPGFETGLTRQPMKKAFESLQLRVERRFAQFLTGSQTGLLFEMVFEIDGLLLIKRLEILEPGIRLKVIESSRGAVNCRLTHAIGFLKINEIPTLDSFILGIEFWHRSFTLFEVTI